MAAGRWFFTNSTQENHLELIICLDLSDNLWHNTIAPDWLPPSTSQGHFFYSQGGLSRAIILLIIIIHKYPFSFNSDQ